MLCKVLIAKEMLVQEDEPNPCQVRLTITSLWKLPRLPHSDMRSLFLIGRQALELD